MKEIAGSAGVTRWVAVNDVVAKNISLARCVDYAAGTVKRTAVKS